jgi:hypothetical protein
VISCPSRSGLEAASVSLLGAMENPTSNSFRGPLLVVDVHAAREHEFREARFAVLHLA